MKIELTPEIEDKLLNPRPGSKVEVAKKFGTDLTLNIGNLRLTPEQRVDNLQKAMRGLSELQRAGESWRKQHRDRTRTRD